VYRFGGLDGSPQFYVLLPAGHRYSSSPSRSDKPSLRGTVSGRTYTERYLDWRLHRP
jgi:hypothetical protein